MISFSEAQCTIFNNSGFRGLFAVAIISYDALERLVQVLLLYQGKFNKDRETQQHLNTSVSSD